ncbi:hypothetical protein [Crenobacter caeni]|uniref:Uncharacterized protein n=1 Tax=Crenobacter caeni TaxID=2705474 RepID=A0A6B2KQH7_9NEIS|nr:hypothetical protein [Crenobacter caeni]NDV12485.1 hypothetical protein [Crenobacter caeni]
MHEKDITLTGEATGLPRIAPNALHMAERDGLMAALRMLHTLRWHLDGHEYPAHGKQAATAFADSFFGVFSACLLDAMTGPSADAVDVFMASLIEQCPALIAELERGLG